MHVISHSGMVLPDKYTTSDYELKKQEPYYI